MTCVTPTHTHTHTHTHSSENQKWPIDLHVCFLCFPVSVTQGLDRCKTTGADYSNYLHVRQQESGKRNEHDGLLLLPSRFPYFHLGGRRRDAAASSPVDAQVTGSAASNILAPASSALFHSPFVVDSVTICDRKTYLRATTRIPHMLIFEL